MLLYQNNLAITTALKGKSYVPVRRINMLVDIGVKVRGPMAKASTLFSALLQKFQNWAKYSLLKSIFPKKGLHFYLE